MPAAGYFNKGYEILLNIGLANAGAGGGEVPASFYFTLVSGPTEPEVETLDELYEAPKIIYEDFERFEWVRQTSNRYFQAQITSPAPGYWWARYRAIAWTWEGDEELEVTDCVMLDSDSDTANCIAWWALGDLLPMKYNTGDPIYIPNLDFKWVL